MKHITSLFLLLISLNLFSQEIIKIKPITKYKTEVEEPSDICQNPNNKETFFMVSDNGFLYETTKEGKIIRTADFEGLDTEAVFAKDNKVYVVQEFSRKITIFDAKTLKVLQTKAISYGGGRNKGYEALTYNEAKKVFVLITEKDQIIAFELDENFIVINELNLDKMARDISAATYYNNNLWLLSDEDRTVFKLNPLTYEVIQKWIVPVINPEGISFDANGNLIIVSDDLKQIFYFNNLDNSFSNE